MKTNITILLFSTLILLFTSCNNSEEKKVNTVTTETPKPDSVVVTKGPIINIEDTIAINQTVLCIKDSALTVESMMAKLANIYTVKLAEAIKSNKILVTGAPIAWQTMQKNAYFFEAGLPVSKAPSKFGKGMYVKNTSADSAIVAHFWGPLAQTKSAYDALTESLTDKHKTKADQYEIYKGTQFTTIGDDPYKQQTDIVVTYKSVKSK
jgi:hypothetical protein